MREIKFRIFDKEQNKMHYCDKMEVLDNGLLFENSNFDLGENHNDDKSPAIMQFTGIKDSVGNDIYEGDKVKGQTTKYTPGSYIGHSPLGKEFEGVVNWHRCAFRIRFTDQKIINKFGGTTSFILNENDKIQVIGNVYEPGQKNEDEKTTQNNQKN